MDVFRVDYGITCDSRLIIVTRSKTARTRMNFACIAEYETWTRMGLTWSRVVKLGDKFELGWSLSEQNGKDQDDFFSRCKSESLGDEVPRNPNEWMNGWKVSLLGKKIEWIKSSGFELTRSEIYWEMTGTELTRSKNLEFTRKILLYNVGHDLIGTKSIKIMRARISHKCSGYIRVGVIYQFWTRGSWDEITYYGWEWVRVKSLDVRVGIELTSVSGLTRIE